MVWELCIPGDCSYCTKIILRSVITANNNELMANSVYKINKGINKPIEFKGVKAQYIWYLAGGFVILLILFVVMYLIGINTYVCLVTIVLSGTILFIRVQRLSLKYGEHGMMKKVALNAMPKVIKCTSRKIAGFTTILLQKRKQ